MDFLKELLGLVAKNIIFALVGVWLYESTKDAVFRQWKGKSVFCFAASVFIWVLVGLGYCAVLYEVREVEKKFPVSSQLEVPPKQWGIAEWRPNASPEIKEKITRMYASQVFRDSGDLIQYFDVAIGGWQVYRPSEKDLWFRSQWIEARFEMQFLQKRILSVAINWLGCGCTFILLGWYMGRKRRSLV